MIIPAIDIKNGKSVRLLKGNFDQQILVADDPVEQAIEIEKAGIKYLHLVDLDGAKNGYTTNFDLIAAIRKSTDLVIELGGGIRTASSVSKYFSLGIDRITIGSAAIGRPDWIAELINSFSSERISISIDEKNGFIKSNGWTQSTKLDLFDLIVSMKKVGAKKFVVTDIDQDGTLKGGNIRLMQEIRAKFPDLSLTASGGIKSVEDIYKIINVGIEDVIVGRAIFQGNINLSKIKEINDERN